MASSYAAQQVCRLPLPDDNCAIATRRLEPGTKITFPARAYRIEHTVLEGHRFAVQDIAAGEELLSWGLPFGVALQPLAPGTYVCNQQILDELRVRNLDFELPSEPNFRDGLRPYVLEANRLHPGRQVEPCADPGTFLGYRRDPARGVGTRNCIVLLGTTSRTASFVRLLEERLRESPILPGQIDGIVSIAHTEGGSDAEPNNREFLLRALAGFMVHPNVGAVVAVDDGSGPFTNQTLQQFMRNQDYPLALVLHRFLTLEGSLQSSLRKGEKIVRGWLETVTAAERTREVLSGLRIALQCGGSDAFSGVSANPLAGWVGREIIRQGGAACLAETDELIGAESYVLKNVRDLETAQRFLFVMERFKERVAWHGHTAEGNPSGGNKLRGLYNITLKSIGAAMKLHAEVRLDRVIDYGERVGPGGFYFMDSPGNDLESVAGQVAAGCNLIFFTTGNGSITNFPFVPTIKIMSTTQRYELVQKEMDVNAGAYLDGTPLPELGEQLLALSLEVASGARTKGELAGHSQVSIWRDWQQTDASRLEVLRSTPEPRVRALPIRTESPGSEWTFEAIRQGTGCTTDQIGLILPTSLCSGQIARMIAGRLNRQRSQLEAAVSRFVALVHTEGCGVSGGSSEILYSRTLLGYLTHPLVKFALLLEHGCEKTHNAYMRRQLEGLKLDRSMFGWASVQLDGGIEQVVDKAEGWFAEVSSRARSPEYETVGLECLSLGLMASGPLTKRAADSLADVTRRVVGAGGTVVVPESGALASSPYLQNLLGTSPAEASLPYGQKVEEPGFYLMDTPTRHWVETLTGLGATGVQIMLACVEERTLQSHPMIPMLQIGFGESTPGGAREDLDLDLEEAPEQWPEVMLRLLVEVASRRYTPKLFAQGNTDFQFARGRLGVSM